MDHEFAWCHHPPRFSRQSSHHDSANHMGLAPASFWNAPKGIPPHRFLQMDQERVRAMVLLISPVALKFSSDWLLASCEEDKKSRQHSWLLLVGSRSCRCLGILQCLGSGSCCHLGHVACWVPWHLWPFPRKCQSSPKAVPSRIHLTIDTQKVLITKKSNCICFLTSQCHSFFKLLKNHCCS